MFSEMVALYFSGKTEFEPLTPLDFDEDDEPVLPDLSPSLLSQTPEDLMKEFELTNNPKINLLESPDGFNNPELVVRARKLLVTACYSSLSKFEQGQDSS